MRNVLRIASVLLVTTLAAVTGRSVENTWDYSVQASSAVQASPAKITLSWPQDTNAVPSSYTIYRKAPGATAWGSGTVLPGSATTYGDSTVAVGTPYEYRIVKAAGGYTGYGYIQTGINVPLVENRGKVVLVVDNTHTTALASELTRLQQDLTGDGWTVLRRDVSRTATVASVKALIKADYTADPANVKAVFLFGHVPVPYSGQQNPDGHSDHIGAWPADAYYGDMTGTWTDSSVNYRQTVNTDAADAARLTNIPGDGKFDQTTLPAVVTLQVGRVDLANLPGRVTWGGPATFASEQALLRQYLNKDHDFRHRVTNVQRRGVVGDYFGARNGEAFAASGHRAFTTLFGPGKSTNLNIRNNDAQGVWVPELKANDYLWAYGCGAGSYTTISGLGNAANYNGASTPEIVSNDIKAVFVMLFGSWLGDWDHEDSILRSVLATPTHGLASMWAGRPHWFVHPMGLGETIGACARLTQNNNGLYQNQINSSANRVHVALMGDPTLRLHPVAPPRALVGSLVGTTAALTWSPSADTVLGYHVYRASSATGPFTRLTSSLLTAPLYTAANATSGATYMVRAVKLENTSSGSYHNASQGIFWTVGGTTTPTPVTDTSAPSIALTAPTGGSAASGASVAVSANAADNVGVVGVQFKLDGANLGAEDLIAPFTTTWNSTTVTNGTHVLTAVARDLAGNVTTSTTVSVNVSNTVTAPPPPSTPTTDTVWLEDALPSGAASSGTSGGDTWNWVGANPAPFSGTKAHQSAIAAGQHEHAFNWATPLVVGTGDVLFTYVYLDPANPPSEIMLSWVSTNWEHRAYWGANTITYGTNGTASRRYMGALPAAGQWVRLEVPASSVDLAGASVQGMCFSLVGGRATWDRSGKGAPAPVVVVPVTPTVTVAATDAIATIGSSTDTAVVTFSRTGSTTAALTVNFALGGSAVKWTDYRTTAGDMPVSVTIPAGASSSSLTLVAVANTTGASPATATFTLAANTAYLVGTASSSTVTLASGTVITPTPAPAPTEPTPTPTPTPGPVDLAENTAMRLPEVGDHALTVLTPTVLELERVNTKQPDPATVDSWNFVNSSGVFTAPATSSFAVTVNGQSVSVSSVGFKRRVRYAPLDTRDLRIGNSLYLQLASSVPDGATVKVTNPGAALWPATMVFSATADALRYSPAIHVNQEGYVPSMPKKAMIGYYLGSKGELDVSATSFKLVSAATGVTVHQGTLAARKDFGYPSTPTPYQKVLVADFSTFTTPGEYQLVVPGLGASFPFLIDDGIAMGFLRTYSLGLYHQRCGASNALPHTRFVHDACHTASAEVPSPQSAYQFTWTTIASKNADTATADPAGVGPQLKDEASQLYPFVNKGVVNVSGGHHDAGDYSKYTINSAQLSHLLMFTADSIAGASALDNLGLPESADGVSDILQEAKHEADYISKLQDADGGFYFIVYPKTREYESSVLPDHGDQQVVWPKNTSATAAAVAALAQCASSPKFKAAYPQAAAAYLTKAKLGWQFLMNGIAKYGKNGAYQKITFYGSNWIHNDEIAWAACELFLATGDTQYQQKLFEWFPNPSDPATFRWGWWRCSESWGNAMRSYAFAARSGRLAASQLNASYLAACETQIKAAGDDALTWSNQNAYGSSFPYETKRVMSAGWYFSLDQASDMATAYQLNPRAEYIDALVSNMNYEGGSNPVNVALLTGVGLKRQQQTVNQYAKNDRRLLTPTGVPIGNIHSNFDFLTNYGASGNELAKLSFPADAGSNAPYAMYDRWADSWNVTTEFITVNQGRSVLALTCLATRTNAKSTAWKSATAQIVVPTTVVGLDTPVTLSLVTTGLNLTNARIVWEGRDQQPDFGPTYTFTPKNTGAQWVEAEISWPDGRRVFAAGSFTANSPVVTWVDDVVPAGASTSSSGGDAWGWSWVGASPAPYSGTKAHQSAIATGLHEHGFNDASSPLVIGVGDKLFAYVYLDPANLPTEIMLHWNDGTWDHRAYWGANSISYGTTGTASRYSMGALPAAGQWVRLEVPASAVGLEGRSVKGMCFSAFGGRVTWDAAGKTSPVN